jgi:hypothetical protein
VILPIWLEPCSVNQSAPSGPPAIPTGVLPRPGTTNSLTTPAAVILPISLEPGWVNQMFESGPWVIPLGMLPAPATMNSTIDAWMSPAAGSRRPMRAPARSVNQMRPPAVARSNGSRPAGKMNSVTTPAGVTRAIRSLSLSATQRLPSGPAVMPMGWDPVVGRANSVIAADA